MHTFGVRHREASLCILGAHRRGGRSKRRDALDEVMRPVEAPAGAGQHHHRWMIHQSESSLF